jgi:uncharacterized protein (TIGR03435 family)
MTTTDDSTNLTKIIAHNLTVAGLLETAYSISQPRMILPANLSTNQYELMLTLPSHQMEALQEAVKQKFGVTARRESREINVLMLKIKDPALLALHGSKIGSKMNFTNGPEMIAWSEFPLSDVARHLEVVFNKPVLVQEGFSDKYNIIFRRKSVHDEKQALSNELAQAGLELVPTNRPIEMLVVEKAQ